MSSFGNIKSKVEKLLTESYGKPEFKTYLKGFKKHILNNKSLSEAYFIYDELSTEKGLNESIADEFVSESFEQLKSIIETNKEKIDELSKWIDDILKENVSNNYEDIDMQVYTKNVVKNLEKLIESKQRIKSRLLKTKITEQHKELNIPISSMLKIAANSFNKEYKNLNEEDKSELKFYTSLNKKSLNEEITKTKESVLNKLNNTLNESQDNSLKQKINETIDNIMNTKQNVMSLYKLKKLEKGL